MERRLLDALGFQCTVPTSRVFVRRFVQAAAPDFRDSRCRPPTRSSGRNGLSAQGVAQGMLGRGTVHTWLPAGSWHIFVALLSWGAWQLCKGTCEIDRVSVALQPARQTAPGSSMAAQPREGQQASLWARLSHAPSTTQLMAVPRSRGVSCRPIQAGMRLALTCHTTHSGADTVLPCWRLGRAARGRRLQPGLITCWAMSETPK